MRRGKDTATTTEGDVRLDVTFFVVRPFTKTHPAVGLYQLDWAMIDISLLPEGFDGHTTFNGSR
jgi:hypothetical protein